MSNLTKKIVEKKYNCECFKDSGFDDSRKYWVALEKEQDDPKFIYADGWTLEELVENIKEHMN